MTIQYEPQGVCSKKIDVTVDNGIIKNVQFTGGCSGNTQGVACLIKGMDAREAIGKIAGIRCGTKDTSCPAQLAKALTIALNEEEKQKQGV